METDRAMKLVQEILRNKGLSPRGRFERARDFLDDLLKERPVVAEAAVASVAVEPEEEASDDEREATKPAELEDAGSNSWMHGGNS